MSISTALRRAALFVAALFTFAGPLSGQDASTGADDLGRGYFEVGVQGLDLAELNEALVAAGYPELPRAYVTLGGGGWATRGPLVIGGEGHGMMERIADTQDGGRRIALSGGYAFFRLGARISPSDGLDVVPLLGVGGGGMNLIIKERSSPTFEDVIDRPGRSSRLMTTMVALDASLAVHYRVRVSGSGDRGRRGGLLVGIHGGYTFVPAAGSWRLDGLDDIAGGPDARIRGAYLRIAIGGWGGR